MNSFTFHEPTQHGTPDFPCEYYYVTSSHPRYCMPFHWHKEWEIIHIIEGTFTVHADDALYTAKSGDMLLIQDGMLHGGTPEKCVYECFLFDLHGLFRNMDRIKKYLRPIYRQQILPDIYYPVSKLPEIDSVTARLSEAYQSSLQETDLDHPLELIVTGCICQLFASILQTRSYTTVPEISAENTRKTDQIKTVLEYIELHYSSSITLSDLARTANMNPKYFCRFFRSITHQTPMEYVNMYRIEKAAQMLHSTRLPVTDVCMECGFNDCSNFIKVFRKYKGVTPNQYRKS